MPHGFMSRSRSSAFAAVQKVDPFLLFIQADVCPSVFLYRLTLQTECIQLVACSLFDSMALNLKENTIILYDGFFRSHWHVPRVKKSKDGVGSPCVTADETLGLPARAGADL